MDTFSEESQLLISNWETVEDIIRAKERLATELSAFLASLESDLKKEPWWPGDWEFVEWSETVVFIENAKWQVGGEAAIEIGVDNFTPEAVFGMAKPPGLYIWAGRVLPKLRDRLITEIEQREGDDMGSAQISNKKKCVLEQPLRKCLPGEGEDCVNQIREQIVGFLRHWAGVLSDLDSTINEYL